MFVMLQIFDVAGALHIWHCEAHALVPLINVVRAE